MQAYGQGNVNDTFLVTPPADPEKRFILQRLNPRVFPKPELVMQNLRVLVDHVQRRLDRHPPKPGRRWEMPRIIVTREGRDWWLDAQDGFWRALSFIAQAQAGDTIREAGRAAEVGYALGRFHLLVSDLPAGRLADTLPGFHVTPHYLRQYDEVTARRPLPASPEVDYAVAFINARRDGAAVLEQARQQGALTQRPIHGDPKINNVMLDAATGLAVGLIDLDTVKPGLVHYDIGDCLRSACNPAGEETTDLATVRFDTVCCRAILRGYCSQAREFLRPGDYDYLFDGVRLIAFELGLRFFTDHLAGNVYFKARHPRHNLDRALVQFKLTESIESQETDIRNIIRELR